MVTREERRIFDRLLDQVLAKLPPELHRLLEEVPLIVEDEPSPGICRDFELEHPGDLCGLHDGIPLPDRSHDQQPDRPDCILIFREGILCVADEAADAWDEAEIRNQIRITLLHEIGHHFGMTEEQLQRLGYG